MPLSKNFSIGLKLGVKEKSTKHLSFSHSEIIKLWENISIDFVDTVLMSIYTGLRPSELLKIEKEKVYFSERYMIGGIKTEAGINRTILIHEDIAPLIEARLLGSSRYLIEKENKKIRK